MKDLRAVGQAKVGTPAALCDDNRAVTCISCFLLSKGRREWLSVRRNSSKGQRVIIC